MLILSNMTNLARRGRCQNKNKRVSCYNPPPGPRGPGFEAYESYDWLHLFLIKQIVRTVYCSPAQSPVLSWDFCYTGILGFGSGFACEIIV